VDNVSQSCETHDETQARVNFNNVSSNNVSGDFLKTLSSIPNERGFKMAFLNIVSLQKNINETNFSITNKLIDPDCI
jgi:hypothetical protein